MIEERISPGLVGPAMASESAKLTIACAMICGNRWRSADRDDGRPRP